MILYILLTDKERRLEKKVVFVIGFLFHCIGSGMQIYIFFQRITYFKLYTFNETYRITFVEKK